MGQLWATNFGFVGVVAAIHQTHNLSRSCSTKSTNQHAAFLEPATNVFVASQVDHTRWKTRNIDQNLQQNSVVQQVEVFLYLVFRRLYFWWVSGNFKKNILKRFMIVDPRYVMTWFPFDDIISWWLSFGMYINLIPCWFHNNIVA